LLNNNIYQAGTIMEERNVFWTSKLRADKGFKRHS
jgi:hypothetical protein